MIKGPIQNKAKAWLPSLLMSHTLVNLILKEYSIRQHNTYKLCAYEITLLQILKYYCYCYVHYKKHEVWLQTACPHTQSCTHFTQYIKNRILQQLTEQGNEKERGRGIGIGRKERRKEKESGKCRPPGTQHLFIQPAC